MPLVEYDVGETTGEIVNGAVNVTLELSCTVKYTRAFGKFAPGPDVGGDVVSMNVPAAENTLLPEYWSVPPRPCDESGTVPPPLDTLNVVEAWVVGSEPVGPVGGLNVNPDGGGGGGTVL